MVESNEKLIAYCGLYCGDCFGYQGKIADLARDLRKELRRYKFDRTAKGLTKYFKDFKDYDKCYKVLGAFVRLRCRRGCCNGGGNPMCSIRRCCDRKKIRGCWLCDEFEKCKKFDFLETIHADAMKKNLRRLKKNGMKKFVKGKRDW